MRIRDPELRDRLAGEYVLGTMTGSVRRNFERMLKEDILLRRAVEDWDWRLNPLVDALPPTKPPRRVWRKIKRDVHKSREAGLAFWNRVNFWRGIGLAAASFALFLIFKPIQLIPPETVPQYVIMFMDSTSKVAWYLRIEENSRNLLVKAITPPSIATDKDHELWLLLPGGQAPRSLGLLPQTGLSKLIIEQSEVPEFLRATGLAVSVEPQGGSPTGTPTGPVIMQAPVISL